MSNGGSDESQRRGTMLLVNATVIDGTGGHRKQADVLIEDGIITAVEPCGRMSAKACHVHDLSDLILAPGFIDAHSHADNAPLLEWDDVSKLVQGVTTEVVGNCGFSLAPRSPFDDGALPSYSHRLFPPVSWSWNSFGELMATTDASGYATNYAPLVGHHAVRIAALGMADKQPRQSDLQVMINYVEEAVAAGAFGLSSGLIYPPGMFADHDEIRELVSHLPDRLIYATHMRNEGSGLLSSVDEAIRVAVETGRRVQISHLKVTGRDNWGEVTVALQRLDRTRAAGFDIRHDMYPYTAASTILTALLPPAFQSGGDAAVQHRLRSPDRMAELRETIESNQNGWESIVGGAGWDGLVLASTESHRFEGLSFAEIAQKLQCEPLEAFIDVLLHERLHATVNVFCMDDRDLLAALHSSWTMIGSDGLPPGLGGRPHPRGYGTFPRVLSRYTASGATNGLTLEEAIRRMSSLPADTFGLNGRGRIAVGGVADLVAFDAANIIDRADYANPTQKPDGIAWVMLGGRLVVRGGNYLGNRLGVRLRPPD